MLIVSIVVETFNQMYHKCESGVGSTNWATSISIHTAVPKSETNIDSAPQLSYNNIHIDKPDELF